MKGFCIFLLAALYCANGVYGGQKWALLVAGSNGYGNYRHQADVAHSYHILVKNGINKNNIVVMMFDDIAYNRRNPVQGNIINVPHGPNLYEGLQIDYRGKDVTAKNFLSILQGDFKAMSGIGTGKVILSNSDDHVFVYYADHGNRGLIAFPTGGMLYRQPLLDAIKNMHHQRKYKHMVFYIEACYSGSMFNRLPNDYNVWAITAANDHQSSWSCYFDRTRRTSLGDLFSVQWMLDTEKHGTHQSLYTQYKAVKRGTSRSEVCLFGDTAHMSNMQISEFQGDSNNFETYSNFTSPQVPITDAVPSWDVPYMSLFYQLEDAKTPEERMEIMKEMMTEEETKLQIRESLEVIASKVTPTNPKLMFLSKTTSPTLEQEDCYEYAVGRYTEKCYHFNEYDYAMKDLYMFSNLCSLGVPNEKIFKAIDEVCAA